jgi:hypothetical protein
MPFFQRVFRFPPVFSLLLVGVACALAATTGCSAPFASDTNEETPSGGAIGAPGAADGLDTGASVGAGKGGGEDVALNALRQAVGLWEVIDDEGKVTRACSVVALASDLVLTTSACVSRETCSQARVRFLASSNAPEAQPRTARCAALEASDSKVGQGFALVRLVADRADEALPAGKASLDSSALPDSRMRVVLVSARAQGAGVAVEASLPCTLRSGEQGGVWTHDCAPAGGTQGSASALGGLLVAVGGTKMRALFERSEGGLKVATPSKVILAK